MNETQLRQQAVMLIDQLSLADLKTVIGYLTNLKNQEPTPQMASDSKSAKNPIAQRIIDSVEKSYDVTVEDAEALLKVIKENQKPLQYKSPFELSEHENQ